MIDESTYIWLNSGTSAGSAVVRDRPCLSYGALDFSCVIAQPIDWLLLADCGLSGWSWD